MGLDKRWQSRIHRTAATGKPETFPHPTQYITGFELPLRRLNTSFYHKYRYTTSATKYDGHVPV